MMPVWGALGEANSARWRSARATVERRRRRRTNVAADFTRPDQRVRGRVAVSAARARRGGRRRVLVETSRRRRALGPPSRASFHAKGRGVRSTRGGPGGTSALAFAPRRADGATGRGLRTRRGQVARTLGVHARAEMRSQGACGEEQLAGGVERRLDAAGGEFRLGAAGSVTEGSVREGTAGRGRHLLGYGPKDARGAKNRQRRGRAGAGGRARGVGPSRTGRKSGVVGSAETPPTRATIAASSSRRRAGGARARFGRAPRDRECETRSRARRGARGDTGCAPSRSAVTPGEWNAPVPSNRPRLSDARTRHDGRARRVRSPLVTQKLRVLSSMCHIISLCRSSCISPNPPTASFVVDVTRRLRGCSPRPHPAALVPRRRPSRAVSARFGEECRRPRPFPRRRPRRVWAPASSGASARTQRRDQPTALVVR